MEVLPASVSRKLDKRNIASRAIVVDNVVDYSEAVVLKILRIKLYFVYTDTSWTPCYKICWTSEKQSLQTISLNLFCLNN